MRKGLVVAAIVIAVALAAPAALAQATTVPLKADLQHALVVWNKPTPLFKGKQAALDLPIIVAWSDIEPLIRESRSCGVVYVIVELGWVDLYGQSPVPLHVGVGFPRDVAWQTYLSPWTTVKQPGAYSFPVPVSAFERVHNAGYETVKIAIGLMALPTGQNAPDSYYGVTVSKVLLAPCMPASETPRTTTVTLSPPVSMAASITANSGGKHSSAATYAAIGIGIIAIGIAIAAFVMHAHAHHRHR